METAVRLIALVGDDRQAVLTECGYGWPLV